MCKIQFIILFLSVVCVFSEVPRPRQQQQQRNFNRRFFQRLEIETTTNNQGGDQAPYAASGFQPAQRFDLPNEQTEGTTETQTEDSSTTVDAPYASAAESKPIGQRLKLPIRQNKELSSVYGPPTTEYGVPQENDDDGTTELSDSTTVNSDSEAIDLADTQAEAITNNIVPQQQLKQGVYFVQLADGSLQRVVYLTSDDLANMEVSARLQFRPVSSAQQVLYNPVITPQLLSFSSQYQSW